MDATSCYHYRSDPKADVIGTPGRLVIVGLRRCRGPTKTRRHVAGCRSFIGTPIGTASWTETGESSILSSMYMLQVTTTPGPLRR